MSTRRQTKLKKVVKYMYEDKKEAKLEEIRRILESKELDEICIDMILSILVNY